MNDLRVTAQYTAATWRWAGLPCAQLFYTEESRVVFDLVNLALGGARILGGGQGSMKRALLHRHRMIDRLCERSGCARVIELAAGFSARGARVSRDPGVHYTELDLPAMMRAKRELLARSEEGQAVWGRANLDLSPGDALTVDFEPLSRGTDPVCVLAEGFMVYLTPAERTLLWWRVSDFLRSRPGSVFIFELTPWDERPSPGRVGSFLEKLMTSFTGDRRFEHDERDRRGIVEALGSAGFDSVDVLVSEEVAIDWDLPFPDWPTHEVIFRCASPGGSSR